MKNELVYCIIATYNGMQWIDKCLQSVEASAHKMHCIVVDNASTDHTVEHITAHYPWVQLQRSDKNLGFGQANNIGIAMALDAGADYLFLINQDVFIYPDCVQQLISAFQTSSTKNYGLMSPVHLDGQGRSLDQYFSFYLQKFCIPQQSIFTTGDSITTAVIPIEFVNAAAWLLNAECVRSVGGFDPVFFHYGEDDNYAQRVRFNGYNIGICKTAMVCHDHDHARHQHLTAQQAAIKEFRNLLIIACDPYRKAASWLFLKRLIRCSGTGVTQFFKRNTQSASSNFFMAKNIWRFFGPMLKSRRLSRSRKEGLYLPSTSSIKTSKI
jgi:GT2 family glycosyltransferase